MNIVSYRKQERNVFDYLSFLGNEWWYNVNLGQHGCRFAREINVLRIEHDSIIY